MKYLVFHGGRKWCESGGMNDFNTAWDTIESAHKQVLNLQGDWAHIASFDGENMKVVACYLSDDNGETWEKLNNSHTYSAKA